MQQTIPIDASLRFAKEQNEFLAKLEACDWFAKTGIRCSKKVKRAGSWEEAFQLSLPDAADARIDPFGDYSHDMNNACARFAATIDRDLFNRDWNRLVTRSNKSITAFFKSHVFKKIPTKSPPKLFLSLIIWSFRMELTLIGFCGHAFKELTFHNSLFLDGYCPCGYEGKYPVGTLIVF